MVSASVVAIPPLPPGWRSVPDRPLSASVARWRSGSGAWVYLYPRGSIVVEGFVPLEDLLLVLRHAEQERASK